MMPSIALVGVPGFRWLPIPIPLFLLWPLVWTLRGVARLLERSRPIDAAKLRGAVEVFRELRGLTIDIDSAGSQWRIRFL